MIVKTGFASKAAAWVLTIFNLIIMLLSLTIFALSLWAISSPHTLTSVIQQRGTAILNSLLPPQVLTIQNGVGIACVACLSFFIALMGFYGAVTRSQFLLFMYATLILLLLLLECALTFYFSSSLIEKGLQQQDGQWTHALRLFYQCCDFKNFSSQDTLKPPWSCCGSEFYPDNCTTSNVYPKDCQTTIRNWIDNNITSVYTSLAVLHIILLSCSLLRRWRYPSRSHS